MYSCKNVEVRHSGKITGFTAFDENHGFRDFRVSVINFYCPSLETREEAVIVLPQRIRRICEEYRVFNFLLPIELKMPDCNHRLRGSAALL